MTDTVRVRFAPSPTGWLHIGGLRTALYNYLFARHHGGTFILRIEDTDQNRYVDGAEADIIKSLEWAGLKIDEGPDYGGKTGPYRQSERSEIYKKYAYELLERGLAYYAFDTPEELESMRESLKTPENPTPKYDVFTRQSMQNSLTLDEAKTRQKLESGQPFVIRLKVPENEQIRFHDEIRDWVTFETNGLDDQILIKSDGLPTYHLANVVDDHLMGITHVIRGEEWLSSAPKHILLYRSFGWEPPKMAHLPLIMSPSGGKLSKRKAEEQGIMANVKDYIESGYTPEAVVNFLAYLGWSPGDDNEIMTLDELCSAFTLERVSKAGAIFNQQKLDWYNEQYFRKRTPESILPELKSELEKHGITLHDDAFGLKVIELMIERVASVVEMVDNGSFFFKPPTTYDEKTKAKAWKESTDKSVGKYVDRLSTLTESEFKAEALKVLLTSIVEEEGIGFGKLMSPIRLAVTGLGGGPDLFQTMELIGKKETTQRLEIAIQKLNS